MSISKHSRKSGATTVKKNGKIVGNIGRGKTKTPAVQNSSMQKIDSMKNKTLSKSTLSDAQQKFCMISSDVVCYEQAQILLNLTAGKSFGHRINLLAKYIDGMSIDGKSKIFAFIEDDIYIRDAYSTSSMPSFGKVIQTLQGLSPGEEDISPNVLDAFARYPRNEWKRAVAHNINTTVETLDFLADSDDTWLLRNVAEHPHVTTQTITKIFEKTSNRDILYAIASHKNTSQKILAELSQSETILRERVAKNVSASQNILFSLCKDSDASVRACVVQNPNTPLKALKFLSQDPEISIVLHIAGNHKTSYTILKDLVKNPHEGIAYTAKTNPKYAKRLLLNSKVERT